MSRRILRPAAAQRRFSLRAVVLAAVAGGAILAAAAPAQAFFFFDNDRPAVIVPGPGAPGSTAPRHRRKPPSMRVRLLSEAEKKQYADLLEKAKKGPLLAAVSLNDQQVTLYADGEEITHGRISSGTASHPTPTGIFSVIQKSLYHRSNIYSNAPMPYMQRITWSGVALHQGVLPGYPASHGCIRLTDLFARQFWAMTKLGVRVVVTREAVAPVAFSHARLFTLPPKADEQTPQAGGATAPAVKLAEGGATASDAAPPGATLAADTIGFQMDPRTLRPAPITVFISRKEGRLYVRKGFVPLFDAPVTLASPDQPIGTHLFTATGTQDDGKALRWTAVSMPSHREGAVPAARKKHKRVRHPRSATAAASLEVSSASAVLSPSEALDRITIDAATLGHISRLMSVGASLIVSDHGLGRETGNETDFIVVTR